MIGGSHALPELYYRALATLALFIPKVARQAKVNGRS